MKYVKFEITSAPDGVISIVGTDAQGDSRFIADCHDREDAELVLRALNLNLSMTPKTPADAAAVSIVAAHCEHEAGRLHGYSELDLDDISRSLAAFGKSILDSLKDSDVLSNIPDIPPYRQIIVDIHQSASDADVESAFSRIESVLDSVPAMGIHSVSVPGKHGANADVMGLK